MIKATSRTLRHGDAIPRGEPRKYLNHRGYVRLRWLIAPNEYLEAYEHRVVMGLPPDELQVHHVNGIKTDNRPENLLLLTLREHALLHIAIGTPRIRKKPRQPLSEYPRCTVEECERPAQCLSRTLCLLHYKRFKRHGSTSDEFGSHR